VADVARDRGVELTRVQNRTRAADGRRGNNALIAILTRKGPAHDALAATATARTLTRTILAANAETYLLGSKPSNYWWMPTSKTTRIRKVAAEAAAGVVDGDRIRVVFYNRPVP
jgi:hypothetical protein